MSRAWSIVAAFLLLGCTGRGPDRTGAVAITAHLALRPAADGELWVAEIAEAIAGEPIEVEPYPIYSDHLPPIHAFKIKAGERAALVDALARARATRGDPGDIVPVFERVDPGWELLFVHASQGFELAPGAMAKVAHQEPRDDLAGESGVQVFLADEDAQRFEQLTRDHLGRRIAMVTGDESLMIPLVRDAIPGGTLWITPGVGHSADELLARLVR